VKLADAVEELFGVTMQEASEIYQGSPCLDLGLEEKHPRFLAVVPMLPSDYSQATIDSIKNQTLPVDDLVVLDGKVSGASLPARISKLFNNYFEGLRLESYDYLLRVDSDTVLPPTFLEDNLKLNVDVVGYGHAHLIKISSFVDAMGGRFNPECDDTYLNFKLMLRGYRWSAWNTKPLMVRDNGKTHSMRYFFERGLVMWKCGYEPLHVLGSVRWDFRNLFSVAEYFSCLIRRVPKFDISKFVFLYQLHKLKSDLVRKRRF
jgi:hypothetical protein